MEPREFLGGKYKQAEQILPGATQTYRAQDSASGRSVYVHRISLTDDPLRQTSLLGLLSAALLRSPKARNMVLDVSQADGFYYVVTQIAPQCLLLREWLQCEIDNPSTDSEESKQQSTPPSEAITQVMPVSAGATRAGTRPAKSTPQEPGEFTRIFEAVNQPKVAGDTEPARPEPVQPEPAQTGPGEFTRFFQDAMPTSPNKPDRMEPPSKPEWPLSSEPPRNQERTPKPGFVQRPNTPVPGEFTVLSTLGRDASTPKPSSGNVHEPSSAPGEFTKLFSSPSVPPPAQEAAVLREAANKKTEEPLMRTAAAHPPPAMPQAPKGPSEYTQVLKAAVPAAPESGAPAASALKIPSGPSIPSGQHMNAAGSKNKLILFVLILGVLAVALVVLIALIAFKK